MISFDNTKVAFRYKTNSDLSRAFWLFRLMNNRYFVKVGKAFTNIALGLHFPVAWAIKPTLYKHFVGGETIEECIPTVRLLEKFKVGAILDYSVEGGKDAATMDSTLAETMLTITNAADDPNISFAVFKPTAFASAETLEKANSGLALSPQVANEALKFKQRVESLCQKAYKNDIPLMIDAEDSCYQSFVDQVVTEMMEKYNKEKAIVYNTLQMYRTDRLEFLKITLQHAITGNYKVGIKFVRGAYMERERKRALEIGYTSPIHPDKNGTDQAYDEALTYSVEHIDHISIFNGTHNEKSNQHLADLMYKHGLAKNDSRIWFAQLYGMSDHISFNLADSGYNVAKYIPYGPVKNILPYLIRRAEENTSIAGQMGRELTLIVQERRRRRAKTIPQTG
ncbi:MAG: proline dehydrogenase family protein [Bacteroidales bacterium]